MNYLGMITQQTKDYPGIISFHGDIIESTVTELTERFGLSHIGDPDKVQYEWELVYNNEIPFHIYDWREDREIEPDELIRFHIGARSKEESKLISKILKNDSSN